MPSVNSISTFRLVRFALSCSFRVTRDATSQEDYLLAQNPVGTIVELSSIFAELSVKRECVWIQCISQREDIEIDLISYQMEPTLPTPTVSRLETMPAGTPPQSFLFSFPPVLQPRTDSHTSGAEQPFSLLPFRYFAVAFECY